jgi:hypothetical protein
VLRSHNDVLISAGNLKCYTLLCVFVLAAFKTLAGDSDLILGVQAVHSCTVDAEWKGRLEELYGTTTLSRSLS